MAPDGIGLVEQTNDIAELGDMLRRLRATDSSFRVFGSTQHRYSLDSPLSEGELVAFESANGIHLPNDYRRFLAGWEWWGRPVLRARAAQR